MRIYISYTNIYANLNTLYVNLRAKLDISSIDFLRSLREFDIFYYNLRESRYFICKFTRKYRFHVKTYANLYILNAHLSEVTYYIYIYTRILIFDM